MRPFDVALLATVVALAAFASAGLYFRSALQSYSSYYLADRRLRAEDIAHTFAAAGISVATVLVFFLVLGTPFGWQILWSPITFALGTFAFLMYLLPAAARHGFFDATVSSTWGPDHRPSTLGDVIAHSYGDKVVGSIATCIALAGMICILVAEAIVGATIFGQYFVKPDIMLALVASILFVYAGIGGLSAVVATDRWQLRLIGGSLVVTAVYLTWYAVSSPAPEATSPRPAPYSWFIPPATMPTSLWFNMLIVNLSFLPSSLRVWQVMAASESESDVASGIRGSIWRIITLSLFAIFAGMLFREAVGNPQGAFDAMLAFLAETSSFTGYIIFPTLIVGMLAAMFSTADSAIQPISQTLYDYLETRQMKWRSIIPVGVSALVIVIAVLAYIVVTRVLGFGLVSWILTVFAISTVIAPVVAISVLGNSDVLKKPGARYSACGGMVAGAMVAAAWSIAFVDRPDLQPWNCVIGTTICAVCALGGYLAARTTDLE